MEGLRELPRRLENAAARYGMEISSEKSKVIVTGNQEEIRDVQVKVTVEGKEEEQVTRFTYLGKDMNAALEKEVETRIAKAKSMLAKLESKWKNEESMHVKQTRTAESHCCIHPAV